jgi:membrane protease YdiL (CAAX protease family)
MADHVTPLAPLIQTLLALASGATLVVLLARRRGERPLLSYQPRPAAPWGAWAPVLLLLPAAAGQVEAAFRSHSPPAAAAPEAPDQYAWQTFVAGLSLIAIVGAFAAALHVAVGASPRDLGAPESLRAAVRDAGLGAVVCLASVLPVFALLWLLRTTFQPEEQHPLIERILADPSAELLAAISFSAVVAAPLFEEFAFRLVLQGWLQRREDQLLAQRRAARPPRRQPGDGSAESGVASGPSPSVAGVLDNSARAALQDSAPAAHCGALPPNACPGAIEELAPDEPGWWSAAPRGAAPVAASSVLFGLAHLGHGVDPAPLVLLGVFLGYVYQRTGRLAPCIVAHALFNGITMILLALQLGGGGGG